MEQLRPTAPPGERDALRELALELIGDAVRAAALAGEARARAQDEAEQRRIVTELAEAEKKAAAVRRIAAWQAHQRTGLLALVPVLVAFAAGLVLGGGAGVLRFEDEPRTLTPNGPALVDSFGDAEGVDWRQRGAKAFAFDVQTPAIALLEVDGAGEVTLRANGKQTPVVLHQDVTVVIRPETLRRGTNELSFEAHSATEAWRIANLRLAVFPLPSLARADLEQEAERHRARARELLNPEPPPAWRHRHWRELQHAWMVLVAIDGEPPPALNEVGHEMKEAKRALDRYCEHLLDEVREGPLNVAQVSRAEIELQFPAGDRCRLQADEAWAKR